MFDTIRLRRNRYLHRWSQDYDRLSKDAGACFHAASHLVIELIGQDSSNGRIVLHPKLVKYLQREGVYQPRQDPA